MDVERYLEDDFSPYSIAATLITSALMIYRNSMTDAEYDLILKEIYDSRYMIPDIKP
jgi:hypothetical protein